MKTAQRVTQRTDIGEAAVTMAIAVLVQRIHNLPAEDKKDLSEVSKSLYKAILEQNAEEEEAAIAAYREILEQGKGEMLAMSAEDEPVGMDGWIALVSTRIKQAREDAGFTQQDLENKTGLPQSHISRLENGVHSPSSATLEKIAMATGKPMTYFEPPSETCE